MLEYMYINNIK